MKSDIEIAQETNELPINEIAAEVDLRKKILNHTVTIRLRSVGQQSIEFAKINT